MVICLSTMAGKFKALNRRMAYVFFLIGAAGSGGWAQIPVEVFGGTKFTAVDIQFLRTFSESSRFLVYSRSRYTVNYANQTDYFISGIVAYTVKGGLGAATEVVANGSGMTYKMGVQYLKAASDRLIYVWLNAGFSTKIEYSLFTILRYQPPLTRTISLYTQLEIVSSFSKEGNLFTAQRPRLGIGIKTVQVGVGGDFSQVTTEWLKTNNVGVFFRKNF